MTISKMLSLSRTQNDSDARIRQRKYGVAGGTNESSTKAAFYDVIGRMLKLDLHFKY